MKESTRAKSKRILDAMLQGRRITPKDANDIGDTTDGTRFIRFIREKFPVKDEKVEGELYHIGVAEVPTFLQEVGAVPCQHGI